MCSCFSSFNIFLAERVSTVVSGRVWAVHIHFRNDLLLVSFAHPLEIELLASKELQESGHVNQKRLPIYTLPTMPSLFRLTLRMIPNEPLPITSSASNASITAARDESGGRGLGSGGSGVWLISGVARPSQLAAGRQVKVFALLIRR